jgi:hypothetical protein
VVEDLKILIVGTCMRQVLKRGSGEDDVSTRGLDATGTSNRDLYDSYRCLYDTCSAYSTIDDCMKYMTDT